MNNKSKKGFTLVEIMIVVVIIGLLAAMAIPAFQKVRATSQNKAILNNLRQYASAAQQYMLEFGATQVGYDDLVGDGRYISTLETVAGEDYNIDVSIDATQITTEKTDGTTIGYNF
ncbi:MAG: prepilin-type N-terminal cleavage/methylation domain-containing protein [Oceanipulchritudo sp.]